MSNTVQGTSWDDWCKAMAKEFGSDIVVSLDYGRMVGEEEIKNKIIPKLKEMADFKLPVDGSGDDIFEECYDAVGYDVVAMLDYTALKAQKEFAKELLEVIDGA